MIERLDDYAKTVLDDQDRVLFEEAVKAAHAGALRAAYLLVWLSCAESLKRRFRAVRTRDAAAKLVAGEIERRELDHRAIDQYILTESKKYGFIDDAGFTRLNHIYEMRCVYGHPYELLPKVEDLIAAAAAATELILSQPTRLRHGYLTEQVRLLSQDRAFLDDRREAVEEYAKEVLGRMDDSLIAWFIEKLWKAAEALAGDKSIAVFFRRAAWFGAELAAADPAKVFKHWDVRGPLTTSPTIGSWTLSDARVFAAVTQHVQDIVVGNLVDNAKTNSRSLKRLQMLADGGALNARQQTRFQRAVDSLPLKVMADVGIRLDYYADRLISQLQSHSWYTQNPAIEVLRNAGALSIEKLDKSVQERLGNNVLQSADGSAASSQKLLRDVAADGESWPAAFVRGLVAECFVNDDDAIRFKTDQAEPALMALKAVAPKTRREIVRAIIGRMEGGTPKDGHWVARGQKDMLMAIDTVLKQEPIELKTLGELRKAVEEVEVPDEDDE